MVNVGVRVNEFILTFLLLSNVVINHGLMGSMFANGPGDLGSISGGVLPKTQKNGTGCVLA